MCKKPWRNIWFLPPHQVVKIAEDVNAEKSGADSKNVKVKLMVWQDAGVPVIQSINLCIVFFI